MAKSAYAKSGVGLYGEGALQAGDIAAGKRTAVSVLCDFY